jgi:hypothetical protein
METVEIRLARSIWFIDIQSLNPAGLALGPIHSALKERYKFLVFPTTPDQFDLAKGVKYEGGEFTFEGKKIEVSLTVYGNGWVGDTATSTEATDAFLNDLVEWLVTNGLRPAKDVVTNTLYDSHIVLKSHINLTQSCEKLSSFVKLLKEHSHNQTEETWAFVFEADNTKFPTFTFERLANVLYSENKYFSKAALPTSTHLQLLKDFERIVGA